MGIQEVPSHANVRGIHRRSCLQWNDLEIQADGLTQRSLLLRKAAARYVDALAVVGHEQGYLAEALDEFCSAADEESVHIGCPLLKNFVHLFADLKDEHLKLGDQARSHTWQLPCMERCHVWKRCCVEPTVPCGSQNKSSASLTLSGADGALWFQRNE